MDLKLALGTEPGAFLRQCCKGISLIWGVQGRPEKVEK